MRNLIVLTCAVWLASVSLTLAQGVAPRRLPAMTEARPLASNVQGTLRRNPEARAGEPPFALLDSEGRVSHYIAPQDGVKLASFVGRRVRVEGTAAATVEGEIPRFTATAIAPSARLAADQLQQVAKKQKEAPAIAPAQFEEELPAPMELGGPQVETEYYPEQGVESIPHGHNHSGVVGSEFIGGGDGCESCSGFGCNDCRRNNGCLTGWYGRIEALYWWTDGMFVPALVTTSPNGTPRADAGVINEPGTTVLFGNSGLNTDGRFGGRLTLGYWVNPECGAAIEGDIFGLSDANDPFSASSPGNPILARPFFDINQGVESSELVAFPNVLRGSITVDPQTRFSGGGLWGRWNLCGCDTCDPCFGCGWKTGMTAGYRHYYLNDSLVITEDLVSLETANPGSFIVRDSFQTANYFDGLELGGIIEGRRGRWSWELLSRVALGNTHSKVQINGFTDATQNGTTTRQVGGLLAQRTNIGEYERDAFSVAPQLGATMGLQLSSVWRVTFGYSFIYWSNVVRAGQQIDRDVNTNLLPPEANPFTGPTRPHFAFNDTDFWAQGINIGLDARW